MKPPNKSFCFRAIMGQHFDGFIKKCQKSLPNPHPKKLSSPLSGLKAPVSLEFVFFFSKSVCRIQTIFFNYRNVFVGLEPWGKGPLRSPGVPPPPARNRRQAPSNCRSSCRINSISWWRLATRGVASGVSPGNGGYDRMIRVWKKDFVDLERICSGLRKLQTSRRNHP